MARQTCRGLLAVQLKDVPARTCTANLLKLRLQFFQSCLLVSIHRLVIRSSLAPMKGVRLSLMRLPSTPRRPIPELRRSSGGLPAGFTRGFFDDEWSAAPPSLRRSLRIAERPKSRLDDRHSLGRHGPGRANSHASTARATYVQGAGQKSTSDKTSVEGLASLIIARSS